MLLLLCYIALETCNLKPINLQHEHNLIFTNNKTNISQDIPTILSNLLGAISQLGLIKGKNENLIPFDS